MASSSYKENAAPPILSLETTWSKSLSELNGDAATYHPGRGAAVLPLLPPIMPPCETSEFNGAAEQQVQRSADVYYHQTIHHYSSYLGGKGHMANQLQHHPMTNYVPRSHQSNTSFFPSHDFHPNANRYHDLYRFPSHQHHHYDIFENMDATRGEVSAASYQHHYRDPSENMRDAEKLDQRASTPTPRHSNKTSFVPIDTKYERHLNRSYLLASDYKNDDNPMVAAGRIGDNVFPTATKPTQEKAAHSEKAEETKASKPTIFGQRDSGTVAALATIADSHLENNHDQLSGSVAPISLASGVPTGATEYVYDGTLEPLRSFAMGLYGSSSLWSNDPPWAGLFGLSGSNDEWTISDSTEPPAHSAASFTEDDIDLQGGEPFKKNAIDLQGGEPTMKYCALQGGVPFMKNAIDSQGGVAAMNYALQASVPFMHNAIDLQGEVPAMNYAAVARSPIIPKCTEDDSLSAGVHEEIQDLLDKTLIDLTNTETLPKSVAEYEMALESLADQDPPDAKGAEALLREMLQGKDDSVGRMLPNESCYNSVVYAYRRARQPHQAERVLRLMIDDGLVQPNAAIYVNVIKAWSKSTEPEAALQCELILSEMFALSDSLRNTQCKPTVAIMAAVLSCWAHSEQDGGAQRAAFLLQQMKTRFLNGDDSLRPENSCYSIVLNAFVRESNMDAVENTMWEMVDDFVCGILASEPRACDLNSLLSVYASAGADEAVQHAECVLARFHELHLSRSLYLKPDGHTSIWLKLLLQKLDESDCTTNATNLEWFSNHCISIGKSAVPSTAMYSNLIEKSIAKGNRDVARDLFHLMIDEAMTGSERLQPDHRIFEMVLSAYCNSQKNRPDPRTGESVMRRMACLSEKMSQKYGHLRPRFANYESLILANCHILNAPRADNLLWEVLDKKLGKLPKALLEKVEAAWKVSRHPDQQRQLSKVQSFMTKFYGSCNNQSSKRA